MSLFKTILGVIGDLTGIKSVGDAVNTIKDAISKDPELQKKLLDIELEQRKLDIQEGNSIRALYKTEVVSNQKFIGYARPAMLWLVFIVIASNFIILPILNAVVTALSLSAIDIAYPELPDSAYWLIGSIFALYTGARSYEKAKVIRGGK